MATLSSSQLLSSISLLPPPPSLSFPIPKCIPVFLRPIPLCWCRLLAPFLLTTMAAAAQPLPEKAMDYHSRNASSMPVVCYSTSIISATGVWSGISLLNFSVPLFILQLLIIVSTSRIVGFVLRAFPHPRYVSEIIGGLVLGPTVLGRIPGFLSTLFPYRSLPILEVMAHFGIIYYVFIIGLEIDPTRLKRSGKHATFAVVCMFFPFIIGAFSGIFVHNHLEIEASTSSFFTFLGVALSITSFSVLARTLTQFKLINTNLGVTTLSTGMLMDSGAWIILSLAFAISSGHPSATIWTLASAIVFMLSSYKVVKPTVLWLSQRKSNEEVVGELPASIILVGVMVWALIADAIGINAISGAFMYGICIPYGPMGVALVERVGDFVEVLLLPLFFAVCGLRTNLHSITNVWSATVLAMVVLLAAGGKVAACVSVARMYEMPLSDGLAMGLLLTTKGIIEMVVLKIGRDSEVLSEQAFSVLVVMSVVVMVALTPLLKLTMASSRYGGGSSKAVSSGRRTVRWFEPDAELRVLFCVHNTRNVPSMVGLLEATHPTKYSPVFVFSLHLIELTGRASAMLVVHNTAESSSSSADPTNSDQLGKASLGRSRHMIQALESYAQRTPGVTIQPLTAVSSYSTMHEDICSVAEDNSITLIVLPFHKQPTVDGDMQVTNPAIRSLNESVLADPPCTAAILVDHGLTGLTRMAAGQDVSAYHIAILFFGGTDDREALALASRMADQEGISLTLFRFINSMGTESGEQAPLQRVNSNKTDNMLTVEEDSVEECDETSVREFRLKHVNDEMVMYTEKEPGSSEETVGIIRSMAGIHDLYIVGKRRASPSPLTEGLTQWCECPELGLIGDMLASKDFGASASVLVIQQGRQEAPLGVDGIAEMVSSREPEEAETTAPCDGSESRC